MDLQRIIVSSCIIAVIASSISGTSHHEPNTFDLAWKQQKQRLQDELTNHELATPQLLIDKLLVNSTATKTGHANEIAVVLSAYNTTFELHLIRNRNLLTDSFFVKYFEHGKEKVYRHHHKHRDHCYYHGTVKSYQNSIASISTCRGVRGMISVAGDVYYIEPTQHNIAHPHLVFRSDDMKHKNLSCGYNDKHDYSWEFKEPAYKSKERLKRSVRWPYDSTDKTSIVELYIANDHQQYYNHDSDIQIVIHRTLNVANIINSLYRQLNIYVALVGMEIWTEEDKIVIEGNADATMHKFLDYRKTSICKKHNNDNAQLITGRVFNENIVGKAIKGTMCSLMYSAGVNMDHSEVVGSIATTIAHEMGHSFGMKHDDHTCNCPDDRCIMAASSGTINPRHWSSCSKKQLSDAFHQGLDYCLHDLPEQLYQPTCGNGFMEEGEQCDCGSPQMCDTHCCDPLTCKLTVNSTCSTGACCDLNTCQLKPAATMCRRPAGECDLAEWCDGHSEFCPNDQYKQNGLPCTNLHTQSYCYNGACNTHRAQCRNLWGHTANNAEDWCYQRYNIRGTRVGNCGFNRWNDTVVPCAQENVMCGMLQCTHSNERLAFWTEILTLSMSNNSKCHSVILDVGVRVPDPGMVADGTPCAKDKLCVQQRCQPVSELKVIKCPDCHGHGVCNTLGQCHCEQGYAPPYCDEPGYGGSLHSGPATTDQPSNSTIIAMLVIFLVIIPLCGLSVGIIYCYRNRLKDVCRRQRYAMSRRFSKPSFMQNSPFGRSSKNKRSSGKTPSNRIYRNGVHASFHKNEISLPMLQDSTNAQPTQTLTRVQRQHSNTQSHSATQPPRGGNVPPQRPPPLVDRRSRKKNLAPPRPPLPQQHRVTYRELSPQQLPQQAGEDAMVEVDLSGEDCTYINTDINTDSLGSGESGGKGRAPEGVVYLNDDMHIHDTSNDTGFSEAHDNAPTASPSPDSMHDNIHDNTHDKTRPPSQDNAYDSVNTYSNHPNYPVARSSSDATHVKQPARSKPPIARKPTFR